MQSAKKVILVPPKNSQVGGSVESDDIYSENGKLSTSVEKSTDKIKSKIYDKIHRFIKVILKLARTVGYDEDLRIKLNNGKYLEKSNIVDLLTHAMSVGKVLYGENEFIRLLAESEVDPDLIINDNVRLKLVQYKNKHSNNEITVDKNSFTSNENNRENNPQHPLRKENVKVIKKGPKRVVVVNEDGATLDLNQPNDQMQISESGSLKRKHDLVDVDDDDSLDDELIDNSKWKI